MCRSRLLIRGLEIGFLERFSWILVILNAASNIYLDKSSDKLQASKDIFNLFSLGEFLMKLTKKDVVTLDIT